MKNWREILEASGKNALWEHVHTMAMKSKKKMVYYLSSYFPVHLAEKDKLAEDCLAEGIDKLVHDLAEKKPRYENRDVTDGLIFSYAKNKVGNNYGKNRKVNKLTFSEKCYEENYHQTYAMYQDDNNCLQPDDKLNSQSLHQLLKTHIDKVCYELLYLHYVEGLPFKEILALKVPILADYGQEGSLRNKASKCTHSYRHHPLLISLKP